MKDHIKIEAEVPREDAYLICGVSSIPGQDKISVGFHWVGEIPEDLIFEKAVLKAICMKISEKLRLLKKQKERHDGKDTGSGRLKDIGL